MRRFLPFLLLFLTGCIHAQRTTAGGQPGTQIWGPGQAAVLVLPSQVNFPDTNINADSANQSITLNNNGSIPATVTGTASTGSANPGDFIFVSTTCGGGSFPFLISPGTSCDFVYKFHPTGVGSRQAFLITVSDARINAVATLRGIGLSAAQPDATLLPNTLAFPDTNVGSTASAQTLTLSSTGNADLHVSSVVDSNSAEFPIGGTCLAPPFTLIAGTNCTLNPSFTPSTTGNRTADITVNSDALSGAIVTHVNGNGIAPTATLTPSPIAFGSVFVGQTSATQAAVYANTGTANLIASNISLSGSNPGDFSIVSQTCGVLPCTVLPGNAANINVACVPTTTGARSATLSVTDNASGSPRSVSLTCTGATPPTPPTITTTSLPNCQVGSPCTGTISVSGGTAPIHFTTPAQSINPGDVDVVDLMVSANRDTQHLAGDALKYFRVDNGLVWWLKGASGCPWDGEMYDNSFVYQWFTEGPTFTNCSGFKRYKTPVKLWPRYFTPGTDIVTTTPGPNLYDTTESCGTDNLAAIDNLDIKGEFTGPFTDRLWQTECLARPGVNPADCTIPNNEPYYKADKYIKGTAGVYQNKESYWLVADATGLLSGYGQVEWESYHWNGSAYVLDNHKQDDRVLSGGAPTPNFACGVPSPLPETGTMPPGTVSTAAPQLNLNNFTGAYSGTPSTAGTYSFTVQAEDAIGQFDTQLLSLVVDPAPAAGGDNRYANVDETCSYPGGATTDDIADLPTACNRTDLAHTPAPGPIVTVNAGDAVDLQNKLNNAVCGEQLVLVAGSVYTGSFTTPALTCDINHWLWIRTSRLDLIPPEGNRALPCDANVQLPNRPSAPWGPGNCGARLRAGMAKIKSSGNPNEEALHILPHSHFIRFIGLEVEVKDSTKATFVSNIINVLATTNTDHIIFDRMWIHGQPDRTIKRGIFIQDGVSRASLIDSSITDIHPVAGIQTDSQIMQGGDGDSPKTGFKCVNNYMESSGTDSCSFGAASTTTVMPTDYEDRRNYEYKPMIWNPACSTSITGVTLNAGGSGYSSGDVLTVIETGAGSGTVVVGATGGGGVVTGISLGNGGLGHYIVGSGLSTTGGNGTGAKVNITSTSTLPESCRLPDTTQVWYDLLGPYSSKNSSEVKNIIRALIEGNVLENCWQHADQNCTSLLLTPKNQAVQQGTNFIGICPACVERHITIRYNHALTSGGFLQAVNTGGDHGVGDATEGSHYSVHDNLAENLNFQGVTNPGSSFTVYGLSLWSDVNEACGGSFVQHDVHIFHNTVLSRAGRAYNAMLQMDGPIANPNPCHFGMVFRDNLMDAGVNNGGINQVTNTACAGSSSIAPNTKFINCWTNPFTMTKNGIIGGSKTWPAGNFFPASDSAVGFAKYNNGFLGDYRLCAGAGNPVPSCTAASAFHDAGTDGKDLGADIPAMLNATAGVSPYN